jgi:CDP-diacylglycerol--glycerol-3-phosphate 3-phosphatidyltransferase
MEIKRTDIFLIPNLLTILRILTYPFIFYFLKEENLLLAVLFIALAVITDVLDGFLARTLSQVSDLGKILDPFVDKLGIGIFILYTTIYKGFPAWACVLVITKEILNLLAGLLVIRKRRFVPVSTFWGKLNACVWSFTIVFYILELDFIKKIFLGIGVIVILITAAVYLRTFFRLIRKTQ